MCISISIYIYCIFGSNVTVAFNAHHIVITTLLQLTMYRHILVLWLTVCDLQLVVLSCRYVWVSVGVWWQMCVVSIFCVAVFSFSLSHTSMLSRGQKNLKSLFSQPSLGRFSRKKKKMMRHIIDLT